MNAYLIAAKANAWELNQYVGRGIEANQPEYKTEAIGHGEGCCREDRERIFQHHRLFKSFFGVN